MNEQVEIEIKKVPEFMALDGIWDVAFVFAIFKALSLR